MVNHMNIKRIFIIIGKTIFTAIILFFVIFYLVKYEYFKEFSQIDNFIGIMPMSLLVVLCISFTVAIWLFDKKNKRKIVIAFFITGLFSLLLFPLSIKGSWFIFGHNVSGGSDWDVSEFAPYKENNKTVKLDEESTLLLKESLPVMDGALALYPVYSAIAESIYDKNSYTDEVMFTNTLKAFDGIIDNERDLIISAMASKTQLEKAREKNVDLVFTPIGKEAFVFIVGLENPVENLTIQQIRNIYSGKTQYWKTLGWNEGGKMICFQRPEGSGSQTGLQGIMKGLPIVKPQPLPLDYDAPLDSLILSVSNKYHGIQNALGYSYRYFATTMYPSQVKLLNINGISPSKENIQSGVYPFTVNFYAITNGEPTGNTKLVIDWILSDQGQRLIEKSGYIPLH